MEKFKNKYRIESTRATWWNYGWSGAYFLTICTKNREHFFGTIQNSKMILSDCGVLADVFWQEIPNHSKNIELGAFVVMPNHIHGILILNNPDNIKTDEINNNLNFDTDILINSETAKEIERETTKETRHALSRLINQEINQQKSELSISQSRFQNQGKNTISSIIGSYKSVVTKHANRLGLKFKWQASFHDIIIRNNLAYQRINNYIENNPTKWERDRFSKKEVVKKS